jgi:hypothetical protein
VVGDELGLALGDRHDRPERLDEPDEVDPRHVGMEDVLVQRDLVVGRRQELGVEEREAQLVARAVDDEVGVDARAVGEVDPVALEAVDVRLRRDRPVREAVEDPAGDRGMRLAELVVGLGSP